MKTQYCEECGDKLDFVMDQLHPSLKALQGKFCQACVQEFVSGMRERWEMFKAAVAPFR